MICKKCGNTLPEGTYICPECGHSAKKNRTLKIVLVTLLGVVLAGVLAWVVYFGVTGRFVPKENNVYYKNSYTVTAQQASAHREHVVATMGEDKLTNGQLQVFYGMQLIDYLSEYGYGFDYTQPLDTQIYDKNTGLTWQQYLLESALNTWVRYRLLANEAEKAGYEMPEKYRKKLDTLRDEMEQAAEEYEFESVDALIHADIGPGCNFDDYKYYMELYYYGNLYFSDVVDKMEITVEEMEEYFTEHEDDLKRSGITKDSGVLVDIRNIFLQIDGGTKDADGVISYTEEQVRTCRDNMQIVLDQWLEIGTTEDNFAQLAKEHSEDNQSNQYGGLYQYLRKNDLTTVDVRHILIMPEGGTKSEDGKTTVYSDDEWEACRQKAMAILNEYLLGEQTEQRFGELAKQYTQDGNGSVGGIYTNVTKDYMVEEFDAWIFDERRDYGDTDLVKTQFGYHVMFFVSRDDAVDKWLFDESRRPGDYEVIWVDDGFQLVYYVTGDEGWVRYCRSGITGEKSTKLLDDIIAGHVIEPAYKDIVLGAADFS